MKQVFPHAAKTSIRGKIYRLVRSLFLPMLALVLLALVLLLLCNFQYSAVSRNISMASGFSRDFKDQVDLKMYYYVTGSSSELPREEVRAAAELARELQAHTRDPNSRKAIANVLYLCGNLSGSIDRICQTEGYDQRMEQLENNVYVITELIDEHVYTYLYHEAARMAALQQRMHLWVTAEVLAILLAAGLTLPMSVRRAVDISRSITRPIDALSQRVEEIGRGDLTARTPVSAEDERLSSLGRGVEEMAGKLSSQIELNRQEQIRLRDYELSLVQAQINPHFLYNTLDAIVWLIETGKNQQAEAMVTSLSAYFRSFLSDGKVIVTVADEEKHVRSYLEIQQVRYKDVLDYEIEIDPAILDCAIPKMTLQPLVENAIYHGLKSKRGGGQLRVSGAREGNEAVLRVRDTGVGMDAEALAALRGKVESEDPDSFGLVAVSKRLKLVYGGESRLEIDSAPGEGTVVTIRIPLGEEENA